MEPFRLNRGRRWAMALPTAAAATSTLRSALKTSGRCARVWAGTFATAGGVNGVVGAGAANRRRRSSSGSALRPTKALISASHCADCWDKRARLSAAAAWASPAWALLRNPASRLRPLRRADSCCESASWRASVCNWRQLRSAKYSCATSAATLTRASCHWAWLLCTWALAASLTARLAPTKSSSQDAMMAPCSVVALGVPGCVRPRDALAWALRPGKRAALAWAWLARAAAMRA